MARTVAGRRAKGKALENIVAERIHLHLMKNNSQYATLYKMAGNPEVKPKRDTSSGVFKTANGDINLGIAKTFFPFSVECKNMNVFENLSLTHLFRDKFPLLYKVLEGQATETSKKAGLPPIMVFHGRRMETFVFWDLSVAAVEVDSGPIFKNKKYRLTTLEVFMDNACAKL